MRTYGKIQIDFIVLKTIKMTKIDIKIKIVIQIMSFSVIFF